jgi:hypothetical protein
VRGKHYEFLNRAVHHGGTLITQLRMKKVGTLVAPALLWFIPDWVGHYGFPMDGALLGAGSHIPVITPEKFWTARLLGFFFTKEKLLKQILCLLCKCVSVYSYLILLVPFSAHSACLHACLQIWADGWRIAGPSQPSLAYVVTTLFFCMYRCPLKCQFNSVRNTTATKVTCQNPLRNPSRKHPKYNQLSTCVGIVCVKQCSSSEEFVKYPCSRWDVGGREGD